MVLWDTTVASRLHPTSDVLEYAIEQLRRGNPVRIAAPAVLEIVYGYERAVARDPRFATLRDWFVGKLAGDTFNVVAFDGRAALVAGRLRGVKPYPPPGRDRRSKTMRQAAWLLDIQIAATAYAAGLDVATENQSDFQRLAALLAQLFPDAPPLGVVTGLS